MEIVSVLAPRAADLAALNNTANKKNTQKKKELCHVVKKKWDEARTEDQSSKQRKENQEKTSKLQNQWIDTVGCV